MYGAASASASSFVVHHTQQISMAAVAGDAENINKQARTVRTNWIKNKQAANGLLSSVPAGGGCAALEVPPSSADGPHPSRTDHVHSLSWDRLGR